MDLDNRSNASLFVSKCAVINEYSNYVGEKFNLARMPIEWLDTFVAEYIVR